MKIQARSGQVLELKNKLVAIDLQSRCIRALKSAGFGMGLAIATLPFPNVYYMLTPVFIGIAIFSALKRFNEGKYLNLYRESCPVCLQALSEKEVFFKADQVEIYCNECKNHLRISC